jgi:competence protein ComEA
MDQEIRRFHMQNHACSRIAPMGVFIRLLAAFCLMASLSGNALAEKVNLNTADAETLTYIPGIGPAKAREIVAVRDASGGFKTMEDLLSVRGIGEQTLEVIRQHGDLESGVSALTEDMRRNPPKRATSPESDATSS